MTTDTEALLQAFEKLCVEDGYAVRSEHGLYWLEPYDEGVLLSLFKAGDAAAQPAPQAPAMQAVRLYAEAFEDLFAQCCSNPIKNAWGQEVNTTKLNAAHAFASRVLAGQEAPQQPAATQDVLAERMKGEPS